MGQPQPSSEIEYGDDCLACFAEGETPKYVYARFSRLVNCPGVGLIPPNDRVFRLTQHDTRPCEYDYEVSPWRVWWSFRNVPVGKAWLRLFDEDDNIYFDDMPPICPDEGTVLHNDMQVCGGPVGSIKGIAVITWRLEIINIITALGISFSDDLFMEMRPKDDGSRIYKLCRIFEGINIAIEYDPD